MSTLKGFSSSRPSGKDPRSFSFGSSSYTIMLDKEHGTPSGVMYFAGPSPTILSVSRIAEIGSPEFIKACEDAAVATTAAVKAGLIVKGFDKKGREGFVLA